MKMVEVGKITLKEAGEKIGVSYRQVKRIRCVLKEKGIRGLIHGNTGQPSHHRIREELRQKVLQLSKEVYQEFNDIHFTEKLREEEGVVLSRETVRKVRREVGMSALLTTTLKEMKNAIQAIEAAGLRNQVKTIVGGAPVTEKFAKEIGADGYALDAVSAVNLVKSLLSG